MFGLHPKDWNTDDVKMNSHRVDSPPPQKTWLYHAQMAKTREQLLAISTPLITLLCHAANCHEYKQTLLPSTFQK